MYIHLIYVVFVLVFPLNDLIYNLLFCVNGPWFCASKILSLEQYLYHVQTLNNSVYSGNNATSFHYNWSYCVAYLKSILDMFIPPMLQNLNAAAETGILPVSIVERLLPCSKNKPEGCKTFWVLQIFKCVISNYCIVHAYNMNYGMSWTAGTVDICTLTAPSLRMSLGGGWHMPFSETHDDKKLHGWVISQHPLLILAVKMFCSHPATIACSYCCVPVPSWNTDLMFLKRGSMGIWHCCVTEPVGLSSALLSIYPCISLGVTWTALKLQSCILMECRAAGGLHLHSWF